MHSISRIRYTRAEAQSLFGDRLRCPISQGSMDPGCIPGVEMELPFGATTSESQVSVVIWVPPALKSKLADWSASEISHANDSTLNLLHNWVFAYLGSEVGELVLPCDAFPSLYMSGKTVVRFVFVTNDEVIDVVHRYTGEDAENLIGGLQAQYACAGPNYRPYRIYSEEELAAVAHLGNDMHIDGWLVKPVGR